VRKELLWRHAIVGVALDAAADAPSRYRSGGGGIEGESNARGLLWSGAAHESGELLDYVAAAKFLNKTVYWVRRHADEIGGVRIGRVWRFPVVKLRELVQRRIDESLKHSNSL
jgi:hypothetical protein